LLSDVDEVVCLQCCNLTLNEIDLMMCNVFSLWAMRSISETTSTILIMITKLFSAKMTWRNLNTWHQRTVKSSLG